MRFYAGNLAAETGENDLEKLFAECGTVEEVHLATHHRTGEFLRYAFIDLKDPVDATEVCDRLDGRKVRERPIKVLPAYTPPPIPDRYLQS
jgi:RNA recognition motif-containing protein